MLKPIYNIWPTQRKNLVFKRIMNNLRNKLTFSLFISLLVIGNTLTYAGESYSCFPSNELKDSEMKSIKSTKGLYRTKSFTKQFPNPTSNILPGLERAQLDDVIKRFENFWNPILLSRYQKTVSISNEWEEERIDARATRDMDDNLIIMVHGALARHPEMNKNRMLLILCHELGHYLGGAPKSFRGKSERRSWSSAEGQADYFATTKCMPKMAMTDSLYNERTTTYNGDRCKSEFCKRIVPMALGVSKVFSSLKGGGSEASVVKKSNRIVRSTNYRHPEPQCRFDTFVAGSSCANDIDTDFDNMDYRIGSCLDDLQPEAARPKCWFSPVKH